MAYPASESYFQSDTSGPRPITSLFFNIPGFFVGFGSRGSSDSESIKSPTSPLDFSFFSNLSNPFTHKPPKSPTRNGHKKNWDCSKVGLGIIDLLTDEPKSPNLVLSSPKRKNIIFGSQVKTGYSMRSNSFPADYVFVLLSQPETPKSGKETESLSPKCPFSSKKFCSENRRTSTVSSSKLFSDGLDIKPGSLPVPISTSHGNLVGSLSAREIEQSEDYTCIISYGPNPKTTHIYGDCILEDHTNELSNLNKTENIEGFTPYYPSDEFLSFCYSCKKKLEEGDDIYIYRGEKAFCSFDCRSEEISGEDITGEEETGKSCNNSRESSPESSYHEDLFETIDM